MFGVCRAHEPDDIRRTFLKAVSIGLVERDRPSCFRSDDEYHEYTVATLLTGHASRGVNSKINFCRDCTPQYKREMMALGQCSHRETVFIRDSKNGSSDIVGVSVDGKDTKAWEQAVMGMMGAVVQMPPQDAVGAVLDRLVLPEQDKPRRGRPPKKNGVQS